MKQDAGDWFKHLSSPHGQDIKRFAHQFLQERYAKHEKYLDRIASQIGTEEDLESFSKLLLDIFESGFMKAFEEYKEQLNRLGYKLQIKPEEIPKKTEPIFPQSEKSG